MIENIPSTDEPGKARPGSPQSAPPLRVTAPLRAAALLLAVNGLLWIGLGSYSLVRFPAEEGYGVVAWVVVGLMFANALVLLLAAWGLGRGSRPLYWVGLAQVTLNLILSVTDRIGTWDLIVLLLNAITLGLMFAQRRRFGVRW